MFHACFFKVVRSRRTFRKNRRHPLYSRRIDMSDNLNKTDARMEVANRGFRYGVAAVIVAILVTIVVPFGAHVKTLGEFTQLLPYLMAIGPALAGLWVLVVGKGRRIMALAALVAAILMFVGTMIVINLSSDGWSGYDALRVWGLTSYIVFGLGATICYAVMVWQLAAASKPKPWLLLGLLGLAAPWFWTGYRVYQDYHHV